MESNTLTSRQRETLWVMNTAAQAAFPRSSPEAIHRYSLSFIKNQTEEQCKELVRGLKTISASELLEFDDLLEMDLTPDQMILFVSSSHADRRSLSEQWKNQWFESANVFRPLNLLKSITPKGMEALDQGFNRGTAAAALVALGVFTVVGPTYVAGLALHNSDITQTSIQTAELLSSQAFEAVKMLMEGSVYGLVLGALNVGRSINAYGKDRAEGYGAPRALEIKLKALFAETERSLVGGRQVNLTDALKELEAIPLAYTNALTHLAPNELAFFLAGDDSLRESILSKNPPSLKQRQQIIAVESKSFRENFNRQVRLMGTTWESKNAGEEQVVLYSTLLKMRQKRQEKLAGQPQKTFPTHAPGASPKLT